MSAMEGMIRTLLKAMDVDVDAVKVEVTSRIEKFEGNVNTLNNTLICIMQQQARMERNQHAIAAALSDPNHGPIILEPIPAPPAKESANGRGNALSPVI